MKTRIISMLTVILFFLSSWGPVSGIDDSTLDAERFEQMLIKNNHKTILDVRTPEEFADGHIPGAVSMNVYDTDFKKWINGLDKTKTIFVYCATGIRSEKASAILKQSGFEKVYHLKNGLKAWNNAQKEITK